VLKFFRRSREEREVACDELLPFTEPSVEFDVTCFICGGQGCATCKHSGWIEMGGAGWVDPRRLPQRRHRSRRVPGLRLRFGIERIAMLRHGLPDLRAFWENDLRVLDSLVKVPVSWLREYVDFDLPVEELARRLVFTSCEVDRIVRRGRARGENLEYFVVGKVLEAGKHPNADKLQLTRVDVGSGEPRSIVCGAWNFGRRRDRRRRAAGRRDAGRRVHDREAQALGRSPRDDPLERELELGQDHSGIMVLSDDLAPGTPLADVLPIGDDILEIETLYNRPDLTSIYGIAREVAACSGPSCARCGHRARSRRQRAGGDHGRGPRTAARGTSAALRDVRIGESPAWLKARLIGGGMRPISNVVDVTNYVMLALGSPLHAFDYDTLAGGRIVVRRARPGEQLETLDGTMRDLDPETS